MTPNVPASRKRVRGHSADPIPRSVESLLPWVRHPGESRQAFAMFLVFIRLGPSGTLAGVQAEMQSRSNSDPQVRVPTMSALYELSRPRQQRGTDGQGRPRIRGHDWIRRASAWFEEQDRQERARRVVATSKKEAATRGRGSAASRLLPLIREFLHEFASDFDRKDIEARTKDLLLRNETKVAREVKELLDRYSGNAVGQEGDGK